MAVAYARLRLFWGALDAVVEEGRTPAYAASQIVSGGPSAAPGSGVGVRRCTVIFDRTALRAAADVATIHFDFLNTTGGTPDDTWTSTDYTTVEGYLSTMLTSLKPYFLSTLKVTEFIWHRVGTGAPKPNPAERTLVLATPIAGSATAPGMPPQVASSITFRTGVRKSWGRTYLPLAAALATSGGGIATSTVDAIAGAVDTMVQAAAGSDFLLVVVSEPLASALVVEKIEVDDNPDVIRRRRWKSSSYKKVLP